jgi:uncharacterized repeat protein (TIGR01451 family)
VSRRVLAFLSTLSLILSIAGPAYAAAPASHDAASDATALRIDPKVQIQEVSAEVVVADQFKDASEGIFLIRLDDEPLATYRGGIVGLTATSTDVTGDRKLDVTDPDSVAYVDYLKASQATFVARMEKAIGHDADVRYTYTNSNNGMAVWLTPDEAGQMMKLPGVAFVQPDFERELQTDTGPGWIGAPSIWGGADCSVPGSCGEGIIVGIIDTGINPSNPSFADLGGDGYDHDNPFGAGNYVGVCDSGEAGTAEIKGYDASFPCNDKLIGAWGYVSVDSANGADSPTDYDGHGSHTASTTAGNFVEATIGGGARSDELIDISGVAPHANIIAYAGCCTGSALTAAIDQAIADGVDVINYSIGSSSASDVWGDFDTVGFLNARQAGVFVATSAGNDGPGDDTLGSPADAPWLTATGASTHSRTWTNEVSFTGGASALPPIDGNGFTDGYGPADIVYAGDFGDALCLAPFAAGTWTNNEIVVCDRGQIARTDKGVNAAAGGAAGLILANTEGDGLSINADAHVIPASHITYPDGLELKAWLATGTGHTASITAGVYVQDPARGDIMAGFSSRGANRAIDIVSPSVSAPGVDIIAAHGQNDAEVWDFISGTSMASPHVAGAGALLTQQHPDWTPAELQSALMLTANTAVLDSDEVTPATPFGMGSGVVVLDNANNAGLVMDETYANYLAADPAASGDPKTLNLGNMANSQCVLACSWERTVTATTAGTWTAAATADGGVVLTVSPTSITLAEDASATITVTADVSGAPSDVWAFGEVTLTATGVPDSHMPVAVQPSTGSLPGLIEIDAPRNAGSTVVTDLTAIEITELTIETFGLAKGEVDEIMLDEDPTNGDPYDNIDDGTVWVKYIDVPAGAQRLVAETFDTTSPDLDLYVGTGTVPGVDTEACFSATGSALEYCSIDNPTAGPWWILVQNWTTSGTTDPVSVSTAVVAGDEGNLLIEGPAQHPSLDPFDIRVLWDDDAMEVGDLFYGAFSLGTSPANAGNVGVIDVDLDRVADDVTKTVDTPVADPGDTVTYTIAVAPNPTPFDLTYEIEDFVPKGLTYMPGSATGGLSLRSDGALTWSGVMEGAGEAFYTITDSDTDAMCDTGFGGYVDLEGVGIFTDPTIEGDTVTYNAFSEQNPFGFYGDEYAGLSFTDDGFLFFGDGDSGATPWTPQTLPDADAPNNVLAALWNDMEIVYDLDLNHGVSLASAGPDVSVIEFDDIYFFGGMAPALDMQVVLYSTVDNTPGFYEAVVAFDNIATAPTEATIGVENATGTAAGVWLNAGDSTGVISDGYQICFDLTPALGDPVVLTYQVMVDEGTEGTVITNEASHGVNQPGANEEVASVDLAIGDVTPPTDGAALWATQVLSSSLTLNWDAATDDVAVTGYGVYQDGAHLADVAGDVTTYDVSGLTPSTDYEYTVKAMDENDNMSDGLMLEVATATDFTDDDFSIFEDDIEWLFSAGITRGCNPPTNDQYCPEDTLTRGQLAAMLTRGLELPASSRDFFTDDDDSEFENDINAVAATGITLGCNPPANTNFCPDDSVTRGEMAAMFDRGLSLPATATDFFTDDDDNIFEDSINRLAEAGITHGCNPPTNDNYCPDDLLTRGQIAAFFRRALG